MTPNASRSVHANRINSHTLPAAGIAVDSAFTYVGGPRVQLYGIAHAEQHLFVIADEQRVIERLVWVQFEGFLPDNQRSYRYPVTQTVDLAGCPFIYDTSTVAIEGAVARRPDSDLAAARAFLHALGYQLRGEVRAQRFVHLIGTEKRHELMIIYAERGSDGGNAPVAGELDRALASFSVQFL